MTVKTEKKKLRRLPDAANSRIPRPLGLGPRASMFMGFHGLLGWVTLAFATPLFWLFVTDSEVMNWVTFRGETRTVTGVVEASEWIEFTDGNNNTVSYRYDVHDKQYEGMSYTVDEFLDPGIEVRVEYLVSHPDRSRIEGMRRHWGRVWTGVLLLLPLTGIVLVLMSVPLGFSRIRKARTQFLAHAELAPDQRLPEDFPNGQGFTFRVQYLDEDGEVQSSQVHTKRPGCFVEDPNKTILCSPQGRKSAQWIGDFGVLSVDPQGRIGSTPGGLALLLFPICVIGLNLWIARSQWPG